MNATHEGGISGDAEMYAVVVNDEEQYSLWPVERAIPLGWRAVGSSGTREECLSYIAEHWTDMRPLSLRRQMEVEARCIDPPGLTGYQVAAPGDSVTSPMIADSQAHP